MPWNDLVPTSGNEQTMTRARTAVGRGTVYKLGAGGMSPGADLSAQCDCSGFVAWAIGIPRQVPPGTGGWLDTDAYWRGGHPVVPGLLTEVPAGQALPGDVVVYPDHRDGQGRKRQGHMGIVTQVDAAGRPARVVHCSVGNSRRGDAVQETEATLWTRRSDARVMRVDYAVLRERYAPNPPVGRPAAPTPRAMDVEDMLLGEPITPPPAGG